ncbi:MAG: RNA-binding S4 domain-containing protein [Ruminococcaceae bacterium]|nr:RNA-binding S4 domain-containing protein [Oscillospiraceae bacterium]
MRLDKYLKVSRIIKRRTVANEACDAGRVSVNGKPARASYDVKIGDVIEISFGTRTVKAEVLTVAETVRKEEAGDMYKIVY